MNRQIPGRTHWISLPDCNLFSQIKPPNSPSFSRKPIIFGLPRQGRLHQDLQDALGEHVTPLLLIQPRVRYKGMETPGVSWGTPTVKTMSL